MNAIQPADPFGGFLQFVFGNSGDLYLRRHAPRVMGLVVDYQDVFRGMQLAKYFADIRLIA